MNDELEHFGLRRKPDPSRPLAGKTVLVVEDSRFASEAIRLLCLRSGARIRRADTLASAHRHLSVYRPSIVIVDLGLPDGSGLDLIAELDRASPRVPVLFGLSGDETARPAALKAGADGFFDKPIDDLAAFQNALLDLLPDAASAGPRILPHELIKPDPVALHDDYEHMADVISTGPKGEQIDYLAQFLSGVARASHDNVLELAARALARARTRGQATGSELARVSGLIADRLNGVQVM